MKSFVSGFLENILKGDYRFCGLCFETIVQNGAGLDDEVVLHENSSQKTLKLSEILALVFGEQVFKDISTFRTICLQCVTSAVNSYKFIKVTHGNIKYISTAIENLIDCFDNDDPDDLNTLFVTLNPEDVNVGNQYYDGSGPISTKSEAFEKFLTITNIITPKKEVKPPQMKINVKDEAIKRENSREVLVKNKNHNRTSTVDMVYNGDISILICKECFKEFPSVSNLRNHFLRIHAPKTFKCSECSKSFGTKSLLKTHQAENHINLICSECGKSFTNMITFKAHEKTHYLKIICPDCGRVYKNQNTYKKHLENNVCQTPVRHSQAEAKFTCDHCGKKYTQKITLRVHIQYEHLNYKHHVCTWCNKKFWCQARLKAHIVKHTKEKNFSCTICNGKFVTRESLLYHTRIHTGERPYPCPFCENRFLSASRRQAHLKSQHADPTAECDICHSKFKSVNYLIKHKLIHEQSSSRNKMEPPQDTIEMEDDTNIIPEEAGLMQNILKQETIDIVENIQDEKVVYRIIESDDVYEIKKDEHDVQEDIFIEIREDGKYNIKMPMKQC